MQNGKRRKGAMDAAFNGVRAARCAWLLATVSCSFSPCALCSPSSFNSGSGVFVPKPDDFTFQLPFNVTLTNSDAKVLPLKRRRPVGRIDIDEKHAGKIGLSDTSLRGHNVQEESIGRVEMFGDSFTNAITYSGVFTAVLRNVFQKKWTDIDLVVYSGGASNFADNHLKVIEKDVKILLPESAKCPDELEKTLMRAECSQYFDAIILQEQTQAPGYFPDDSTIGPKMICPLCTFNFNRSLLALSKMAEDISRVSPSVPIIMFQTWGRLNGDKMNGWMYGSFQKMNSRIEFGYEIYKLLLQNKIDQLPEAFTKRMAQSLPTALEAFRTASPVFSQSNNVIVAPCGTAFANVRLIEQFLLGNNDEQYLEESRNPYFNLARFNSTMNTLIPFKDWKIHLESIEHRVRPFRLLFRDNGHPSPACGAYVASVSIALAWKVYLGEARTSLEETNSGKVVNSERMTEYERDGDELGDSLEAHSDTSRAVTDSKNKRAQLYRDLQRRQRSRASAAQTVASDDGSRNSQFSDARSLLMTFLPQHSEAQRILLDSKIGEKVLEKKPEFWGENCIEFIDIYHEAIIEAIIQHNPDMAIVHKYNH